MIRLVENLPKCLNLKRRFGHFWNAFYFVEASLESNSYRVHFHKFTNGQTYKKN